MNDIRDNLRICLKNKGFKQSAIAKIVGENPVTFNQILTKRMRLSAELMFKVCDAISVTPDELRAYDEEEVDL